MQSAAFQKQFHDRFIPFVREHFDDMPNRTHRSYALLLAVTNEVCAIAPCHHDNNIT